MKSSLIIVAANGLPMTSAPPNMPTNGPTFVPQLRPGFILITSPSLPIPGNLPGTPPGLTNPGPYHVLHLQPGLSAPTDVWNYVIIDGATSPWTAAELQAAWPNGSPYVLEATYLDTTVTPNVTRRVKMA